MKAVTLTPCILKNRQRQDKSYPVLIRLTYDGRSRYIPTSMFATRKDLTAAYRLKNQRILDECAYLVSEYRQRIAALHVPLHEYTIDEILCRLQSKPSELPSFTEWFAVWCKQHDQLRGLENYRIAYRAFQRFTGHDDIRFDEVTTATMKAFEIALKGHPTAQHQYTLFIKRIFTDACDQFNDEDRGIMPIRHTLRYQPPATPATRHKALDADMIRRIFAMPYTGRESTDFALDLFRLSFALMGMNGIDLYHCTRYEDGCIVYNRSKTAERRSDGSLMVVRVDERIKPLFDKYRGKHHVFSFAERFRNYQHYYNHLKLGMMRLSNEVGQWVTFYAARHSMATIAVNDCGISKYIVNDMLCHKDPAMAVTDIYIRKDFAPMNDANRVLLDYVLGKNRPTLTGRAENK